MLKWYNIFGLFKDGGISLFKKIKAFVINKYHDKMNIKLIKNSNLMDDDYYKLENPNIKIDPAKHYYYYGFKEGKSPSYNFSNDAYLKEYSDVKSAMINPLVHYLKYGKYENRAIRKDNGLSLKELYTKLKNSFYNYNFYYCDREEIYLNLFIDQRFKENSQLKQIINFCDKNNYKLRIIYQNYNISLLKTVENINKIKIEYIYLNNNDYIFVNDKDIFIATSCQTIMAVLNSVGFKNNLFCYINNFEKNDAVLHYNLSTLYDDYRTIFITDNKKLDNSIEIVELDVKSKGKFMSREIYYCADKFFIEGLFLLNRLFLDNVYDSRKWSIYSVNSSFKYHLDSDVKIYKTWDFKNKSNGEIISLYSSLTNNATVSISLKLTSKMMNFNIIKNESLDELNYLESDVEKKNINYLNFKKAMIKSKCGDDNV